MGEARRPDRVAEAIREQVATFLAEGAKDPRIRAFVTVTAVEVTRDLRHATVFVSLMGDEADKKSTTAGLASVASHLRSQLGKTLRLRSAPEIHFRADESVARASRIEHLLSKIRDEREAQDASAETPDAPDQAE
ncbi:MAG TPA: 30S ribosome-binding factor RbfA [Gemmatimonas sp.]|uniref:30S ribosome-binding factor RbfA n=1 Tax=Gemmatimonas sp. TaxID=1962908 RepID=UPI002EDB9CCE